MPLLKPFCPREFRKPTVSGGPRQSSSASLVPARLASRNVPPLYRRSTRLGSYRDRNLRSFEESLFKDHGTGYSSQEVSFFLLDGSMATLNTGIAVPMDMGVQVPAIGGEREVEIEDSGLGVEALWLASYFRIAATNGLDASRRLWIDGFYRDLEYLAESIHRSSAKRGGEINSIILEEEVAGQPVVLNVIVPFLFGVPAERARLTDGIERGGGIIHSEKLSVLVGLDG